MGVLKAVTSLDSGGSFTCQYPLRRSRLLNILLLYPRDISKSLRTGRGYLSSSVTSFAFRKSMTGRYCPSFFGTKNTGEFHGDRECWITPCVNMSLTCCSSCHLKAQTRLEVNAWQMWITLSRERNGTRGIYLAIHSVGCIVNCGARNCLIIFPLPHPPVPLQLDTGWEAGVKGRCRVWQGCITNLRTWNNMKTIGRIEHLQPSTASVTASFRYIFWFFSWFLGVHIQKMTRIIVKTHWNDRQKAWRLSNIKNVIKTYPSYSQ